MPNHCLVVNCNSRGKSERGLPVSYYRIPAIKKTNGTIDKVKNVRRQEWLKAINRDDIFSESLLGYGRVCSKHFITGRPAKFSARNHIDWIPSVLMGEKSISRKYDDEIKVLANDNKNVSSLETSKVQSQATKSHYCCVPQCSSWMKKNPELSFHTFPKSGKSRVFVDTKLGNKVLVDRRHMWLKALKIGKDVSDHVRVCSLHFKESDFLQKERFLRRTLKSNAVPSKNLPLVQSGSNPGPSSMQTSRIMQETPNTNDILGHNLDENRTPNHLTTDRSQTKILKKTRIPRKNANKKVLANQQPLKNTMFKEINDVLTSTLNDFNTMTTGVKACFDRVIIESKDNPEIVPTQRELCNEIRTLEKSVKNIEGMVVESLMMTNSDLKKKLMSLRFENSSLKKERGLLKAEIALLENREIARIQPQTIIYNPLDTPTILLVTDDN